MYTLQTSVEAPKGLDGLVERMGEAITLNALLKQGSMAAAVLTKQHLDELATMRHRDGVEPNFYASASRAVTAEPTDSEIGIRIDHAGIAQRLFGGTIRAINYPYLWIPVSPESEGKSAREFSGELYPIYNTLTGKGVGIRKSDDKVLFALREEIDQDEDPSVLPAVDVYGAAVEQACDDYVEMRLSKAAARSGGMEATE